MKDYEERPPLKIVRGRGVYLYDENGKAYLDAISSWWVNIFGHSNRSLNLTLKRQASILEHVIFAGCTHEPALMFAQELLSVTPKGLSKIFFADNGSSAIEIALKMSFQYWKQCGSSKNRFISLTGGYHGETVGALSLGGMELYRKHYAGLLIDVSYARAPSCDSCPFALSREKCNAECFLFMEECVNACDDKTVAAIAIEPLIQCANSMNMYPPVYLQKLSRLCIAKNIHLIADEIAVGFGRTGTLFACEQAAITPDFLCLSKGITGGYMPFAAVVTNDSIYDAFYADYQDDKAFLHSHSYTGNPLACSLAREVLRKFREEAVLKKLKPKIRAMEMALKKLQSHPSVRNIRQTGFVGAFDIIDKKSNKKFNSTSRMSRAVAFAMIDRGYFMRPLGDTLYLMPPLITPSVIFNSWTKDMAAVLDRI